jgi:hypothetical protein
MRLGAALVDFLALFAFMIMVYVAMAIYSYHAPPGSPSKIMTALAFRGIVVVPLAAVSLRLAIAVYRKWNYKKSGP